MPRAGSRRVVVQRSVAQRAGSEIGWQRKNAHSTLDRRYPRKPKSEGFEDEDDGPALERTVFPWVRSKKDANKMPAIYETITANQLANEFGVPRYVILDYIEGEVREAEACKSLPFTLVMVLSYSFMVIGHMNSPVLRGVEDSLTFDIQDNANFAYDSPYMGHKNVDDVNGYLEVWAFLRMGVAPLLLNQEWLWSEKALEDNSSAYEVPLLRLMPEEKGLMSRHNRIVGGVRLRQERAEFVECAINPELADLWGQACVPQGKWYDLDPELSDGYRTAADESKTRWLWVHDSFETSNSKLCDWEAEPWLDQQVAKVEIGVPIYNAEYGVHTWFTINLYFSTGGHIWKKIIAQSCYTDWFYHWRYYVFDSMFTLLLAWMILHELQIMIWAVYKSGLPGLWTSYISFFTLIDWVTIVTGIGVIVLGFLCLAESENLNVAAEKLSNAIPSNSSSQDIPEVRMYVTKLEATVQLVFFLQRYLAIYPLVVAIRLFRAFHAQPRLALVTSTVKRSLTDLAHFMLVFTCAFCAFAVSGTTLFGREVVEMATVARSMGNCLRLLYGDLDFETFEKAGKEIAGVWVIIFMIVMFLLLLNMTLAIVMDSYAVVKRNAGHTESLIEEAYELVQRSIAYYSGKYVPLPIVLKALRVADGYEVVDDTDLHQPSSASSLPQAPKSGMQVGEIADFVDEHDRQDREYHAWMQQIIFEEDVLKSVKHLGKTRARRKMHDMTERQALDVLTGAIKEFYEANKRADVIRESVRLSKKIHARSADLCYHGMEASYWNGSGIFASSSDFELVTDDVSVNPLAVMQEVRSQMTEFLEDVQADRILATSELSRLRVEVAGIRKKLASLGLDEAGLRSRRLEGMVKPTRFSRRSTQTSKRPSASAFDHHDEQQDKEAMSANAAEDVAGFTDTVPPEPDRTFATFQEAQWRIRQSLNRGRLLE